MQQRKAINNKYMQQIPLFSKQAPLNSLYNPTEELKKLADEKKRCFKPDFKNTQEKYTLFIQHGIMR